jgi:hypothetical protein
VAYKKIKLSEAPKRPRKGVSRFEATEEWRLMKADIDKGLKPGEALQVVFTDRDKEKYDIKSRRTIARFVKKYLASHDFPYTVKSFERRETGDFVILLTVPPQKAARRA